MKKGKRELLSGFVLLLGFAVWTILIQTIDVKPWGVNSTDIGFSTLNTAFFKLSGVHLSLYVITDWLGLVPLAVCFAFGIMGLGQLIKRKSILRVDRDILILGGYYILVILGYLAFEMIPINYRPILIDGYMESSYPSSTTLLVLCVMPTLVEQINRRAKIPAVKIVTTVAVTVFSAFMVVGRLLSGVHWLTDILGAVLLSLGLFCLYKGLVLLCTNAKK